MADQLRLELIVDDKGNAVVKRFGKDAEKALGRTEKKARQTTSTMQGLAKAVAGVFAAATIKRAMTEWVQLAGKQQQAVAGLEQAMRSMGRYSTEFRDQLLSQAKALQEVTTFGDEATIEGQKFLMTYRDITDDLMPRATKAMLDLAALMGGDTRQAANMLGKASMGLAGELRRVGITIDEDVAHSGDFAAILGEIEKQVGGQARALAATGYGGLQQLGNIIGDTKEGLGEVVMLILSDMLPTLKKWSGEVDEISYALATVADVGHSAWTIVSRAFQITGTYWAALAASWVSLTKGEFSQIGAIWADWAERAKKAMNDVLMSGDYYRRKLLAQQGRPSGGPGGGLTPGGGTATGAKVAGTTGADYVSEAFAAEVKKAQAIGALAVLEQKHREEKWDAILEMEREAEQKSLDQLQEAMSEQDYYIKKGLADLEKNAKDAFREIEDAGKQAAYGMEFGFQGFFDFMDEDFGRLEALANNVLSGISRGISSYMSSWATAAVTGEGGLLSLFKSAEGNVFNRGRVVAMGKGGVVDRPVLFPLARGAGLMGEAGPEGVLPLARTRSGDLGVRTTGGGEKRIVVQLINETGTPMQVEQAGEPTETNDEIFVKMYLKNIATNRLMQNATKGAVSQ